MVLCDALPVELCRQRGLASRRCLQWRWRTLGASVVQAFRRPDAPDETLTVKLRGLVPQQRYEIENLDGGKEVHSGAELIAGHSITLHEKPAAAVLFVKVIE